MQEKLAKNKKAPARHKAEESYLLTTKLYCGKCGALMFGESGVSHTGKMYTYYKCAAAKKKKTCDKKAVRKQRLEALEEQRKELQARIAEERLAKPKMKEEFVRFNRKGRFGILFRPAYFAICNPTMLQTIKKLDCDGCSVSASWT